MSESEKEQTEEQQAQKPSDQTGLWRNLAIGFGIALLVMLIFRAGMFVGMEKARFSYRWGENYHRNFGGPGMGPMGPMGRGEFFGGHGAVGPIIRINKNNIVIRDRENVEKVIAIGKDTRIFSGRDKISKKDLKVDEPVVVIGEPGKKGEVDAKVIRVFANGAPPFPPPFPRGLAVQGVLSDRFFSLTLPELARAA